MKILLTNDDGVNAEGFAALKRIAAALSDDVWVCAPEQEQSGASRGLTLSFPLRARQLDPRSWALAGTPTDCVLLAVHELMPAPPDLVLSGVNRGWNIADDVTYSGTVAGALQAMALGIPGIALSQALTRGAGYESPPEHFEVAEAFGPGLIHRLVEIGWPKNVVMNVNFPVGPASAVGAVEVTTQGVRDAHDLRAERRTDLRGRAYYWMGFASSRSDPPEGTDLRAIFDGRISVTPLHVDLTHRPTAHDLKQVLGGVPPRHVKSEA
jgi:5'-nucleotidase